MSTSRTTTSDVIRFAAGLPPRPQPTPDLVVSRITGAIHQLTDLDDDHLSTACGMQLPRTAVEPHDELMHPDAHPCLDCGVPA